MNLQDIFQRDHLVEADLSQDQIQDLFKQVEKELAAGGDNRTIAGKSFDVAKQAATGLGRAAVSGAKKLASRVRPTPESLSEHEINKLMAIVEAGMVDRARQSASNLMNRITADKLMQAWKQRGSPTDSDVIAIVLDRAGVPDNIVAQAYAAMNLPPPGSGPTPGAAPAPQPPDPRVLDALAKLPTPSIEAWIAKQKGQGATDASPVIQAARDEVARRSGAAAPAAPAQTPAPAPTQTATQTPTQTSTPAPAPAAAPAQTSTPAPAPTAAPAPAQAPAASTLAQGVSIVNDEPIVIRYKNSDFGLNDRGEWALMKRPDRALPQSMSAFLDQQFDLHMAGAPESAAAVRAAPQTRTARQSRNQPAPAPKRQSWLQRMGIAS